MLGTLTLKCCLENQVKLQADLVFWYMKLINKQQQLEVLWLLNALTCLEALVTCNYSFYHIPLCWRTYEYHLTQKASEMAGASLRDFNNFRCLWCECRDQGTQLPVVIKDKDTEVRACQRPSYAHRQMHLEHRDIRHMQVFGESQPGGTLWKTWQTHCKNCVWRT